MYNFGLQMSVFRRRHIHDLKEGAVIVTDIVKSAGECNIGYFFICMGKLCAALQDAVANQVTEGGHTGQLLERTTKLCLA